MLGEAAATVPVWVSMLTLAIGIVFGFIAGYSAAKNDNGGGGWWRRGKDPRPKPPPDDPGGQPRTPDFIPDWVQDAVGKVHRGR